MASNKLIGLAAVLFFSGSTVFSLAACSSDSADDTSADDDDDDDSGVSSSSGGKTSSSSGAPSDPDSGSGTCEPNATGYEPGYIDSATATAGSCSAAQLAAFDAAANDDGATFEDLFNSVEGSCQQCIFTDLGDGSADPTTLAAVGILTSGANKGAGLINYGWCIGNKSGKPACGNAYASFVECGDIVCSACGEYDDQGQPDADREDCTAAAYDQNDGICLDANLEPVSTACGEDGLAFEEECQVSILDAVKELCGGAAAGDAGTDGGN